MDGLIPLCRSIKQKNNQQGFCVGSRNGQRNTGIVSAKNGAKVISVDINPEALKCAEENSLKHKVSNKIEFCQSDLFESVPEKFDVILFNPTFRWFKPRDIIERGEVDEDYTTLRHFFAKAKDHLTTKGKILLVFSDSGDIAYLNQLIKDSGFEFDIIKRKKADTGWKYFVYEIRSSKN